MKTTDFFSIHRSSKRLNEGLQKTFGHKLNLEQFTLEQLQDARNKIRTQVSQVRGESEFNETLENDAFLEAQFILDALNAELENREHIHTEDEDESPFANSGLPDQHDSEYGQEGDMADDQLETAEEAAEELRSILDSDDDLPEWVQAKITKAVDYLDTARDYMKANDDEEVADESIAMEKAPPGDKYERMVKHIKHGYSKDGKLSDKERSIAYATAWKAKNKANESVNTGDNMTRKLTEGEIQQAQSIVTAKTMVDRVGRWIEELSGMENDTLLQLGDQIRDEMSQDLAKTFISTVAPAIQQALESLKGTRETLASGVRQLTGEEQGAEMLGTSPEDTAGEDEFGASAPDSMNAGGNEFGSEDEFGGAADDTFAAAEPSVGGTETAGREKRESIEFQNRLLKVLAG